jgi:type III restriction enzyme
MSTIFHSNYYAYELTRRFSSEKFDFVVETHTRKFLCEPKRASEMNDPDVTAKAEAAAVWCRHASTHAAESGGKPWTYLLIPHDQISAQMTLAGLATRYTSQG